MKNIFALFLVMFCMSVHSIAKVFTINVADNSLTPASFTAHTGDTIRWLCLKGVHATISKTIPQGATSWNNNISSGNTSFTYVPNITGTYNYECTFKSYTHLPGRFTVVNRSGINQANKKSIISVYPNPASSTLHVQFHLRHMNSTGIPVSLTMIDKDGKTWIMRKFDVFKNTDLDLQDIPDGTYYLHAEQGNNVYNQQIIISH